MKVVILDGYSVVQDDLSWDALRELPDVDVVAFDRTRPEETVTRCEGSDISVCWQRAIMSSTVRRLASVVL